MQCLQLLLLLSRFPFFYFYLNILRHYTALCDRSFSYFPPFEAAEKTANAVTPATVFRWWCARHADELLSPVYTIQPVVKPVWRQTGCQTGLTTSCIVYQTFNQLSNQFDNRLYHVNGVVVYELLTKSNSSCSRYNVEFKLHQLRQTNIACDLFSAKIEKCSMQAVLKTCSRDKNHTCIIRVHNHCRWNNDI